MRKCYHIFFILLLSYSNIRADEYFSSITGLEKLLKSEEILLRDLNQHIGILKHHLKQLEKEYHKIEYEHKLAAIDIENYLTNPINTYRLIKRLYIDWFNYENRIYQHQYDGGTYFLQRMNEHRVNLSFPTQEDVVGSAIALSRLQETYQLDVTQLAGGILNGVKYGTAMTWEDCFTLGQQLFQMEAYNETKMWLKESINRLNSEEFFQSSELLDFMESVAKSLFNLGDLEAAINLSNRIVHMDPERVRSWSIKGEARPLEPKSKPFQYHSSEEYKTYQRFCRGDIQTTPAQLRSLSCRYVTNNKHHLMIAPFKVEEHNLDPLVLTFHDMISIEKINTIKEMAVPKMRRSTVRKKEPRSDIPSDVRISKNAWIRYDQHKYMSDLLRDLEDITDLDMSYSEDLQVVNYGLGGHYEPHYDFYTTEAQIPDNYGNRIATVIFYFSDVEQGGATVFPFLGLSVKPKQGNVLFWYNLHTSLERDYRTKHAGCPVLKGSKWIANVWIRDKVQTFRRPCKLTPDHEISLKYKEIK